jgi:hypothetical protein
MSYPIFADYDKSIKDIFDEDFDLKYTFKSKASGPNNTTFTSTSVYKDNKIEGKFAAKWAHSSGFKLNKLEIAKDGSISHETAVTGLVNGLTAEIKGDNNNKADLALTFKHAHGTVTAEVDAVKFASANVSVNSGVSNCTLGANVFLASEDKKFKVSNFNFGMGYTAAPFDVSLRAENKLASYSALLSYKANADVTLAAKLGFNTADQAKCATLATVYKTAPDTTLKLKATSAGVLSASYRKNIEKNFSVVGAVQLKKDAISQPSFGLNITLG